MTFIALAFVLIGSFLILYSVFIYLQRGIQNESNHASDFASGLSKEEQKKQRLAQKERAFYEKMKNDTSANSEATGQPGDQGYQKENPAERYTHHDSEHEPGVYTDPEMGQTRPKHKDQSPMTHKESLAAPQMDHDFKQQQDSSPEYNPKEHKPLDTSHGAGQIHIKTQDGLNGQSQNENGQEPEQKDDSAGPKAQKNIVFRGNALFYVDRSSQVHYDGSDLEVDETLSQYKKFFRIGDGSLSLTNEGITFQNEELMQHFAFEEIQKVIFYQNCAVVLPREGQEANIFFPQKYSLFRTSFKELMDTLRS